MNLTALNRRCLQAATRVLVSGLLASSVALVAIPLGQPAIARESKAEKQQREAITQKLVGQWQTVKSPAADLESMVLSFSPDGKLIMLTSQASGEKTVVKMEYYIDPAKQPMYLDLVTPDRPNEQIKTIFDFSANGLLRLPLIGLDPVTPRPKAFTAEDPPLEKVSAVATLQPDVRAVAKKVAGQRRETEGKLYINALIQAEMAHYLEKGQYAVTLEQLGTFQLETENYRYEIVADGAKSRIGVMALAKRLGLKSFVGAVFTTAEKNSPYTLMATICQSKEPTRLAPRLPKLGTADTGSEFKIHCGEDSQSIR